MDTRSNQQLLQSFKLITYVNTDECYVTEHDYDFGIVNQSLINQLDGKRQLILSPALKVIFFKLMRIYHFYPVIKVMMT